MDFDSRITVNLAPAHDWWIRDQAKHRGVSMSEVVRQAIERAVTTPKPRRWWRFW